MPLLAVIGCALLIGGVTTLLVLPAWLAVREAMDASNQAATRVACVGAAAALSGAACLWLALVTFLMGARG